LVYYKIKGYRDTKTNSKIINDFVERTKDVNLNRYTWYSISFFIASDETNIISLKQHPDRYYNQDNIIYEYTWFRGKFSARLSIKMAEY
jgi:hypothetical protein